MKPKTLPAFIQHEGPRLAMQRRCLEEAMKDPAKRLEHLHTRYAQFHGGAAGAKQALRMARMIEAHRGRKDFN